MTRILHLSTGGDGGAARAARSLHEALLAHGADSRLREADPGLRTRAAAAIDWRIWHLQRSPAWIWRSPAVLGSLGADAINRTGADVVNLHWVTNGFLSIRTIGRIDAPVAWSLVDLWPVCGTEHYPVGSRFREGYGRGNRLPGEIGPDIDRWTWERKRRAWQRPMHLVPASRWLESCISSSALARTWPTTRIPHAVDTDAFSPMDPAVARSILGLPLTGRLVGFLSSAGTADVRKGWDLLEGALAMLRAGGVDATTVIAGPVTRMPSVPFIPLGTVRGDETLRTLYSACDAIAVPSRDDTMPLVAMEAQSCGTPVVAFRIGGLPDIVADGETGRLVEPFAVDLLTDALSEVLATSPDPTRIREHAVRTWSPAVVAQRYLALYGSMVSGN